MSGRLARVFRHYGIAYGDGIVNNLRRAPWKLLAAASLPRVVRDRCTPREPQRGRRPRPLAPERIAALATGKPIVLQLWGSDVALARHVRPLARWLAAPRPDRRLRLGGARRGGARARGGGRAPDPERGVVPATVGTRTSRRTSCTSADSQKRKGCGSSPSFRGSPAPHRRRRAAPLALPAGGWLRSATRLGPCYHRAAVVVVPSRREGYGMVAREAMAHGRPGRRDRRWVDSLDAVEDGVTGIPRPGARPDSVAARDGASARRRHAPTTAGRNPPPARPAGSFRSRQPLG